MNILKNTQVEDFSGEKPKNNVTNPTVIVGGINQDKANLDNAVTEPQLLGLSLIHI